MTPALSKAIARVRNAVGFLLCPTVLVLLDPPTSFRKTVFIFVLSELPC